MCLQTLVRKSIAPMFSTYEAWKHFEGVLVGICEVIRLNCDCVIRRANILREFLVGICDIIRRRK